MAEEPILRGRDENAPFRALNRVILVVAVVVVLVRLIQGRRIVK